MTSVCQDKLKRMELELEEEKSNGEMLTERVTRSRDQMDQLRSELMQERSSKQDLELDKNAMERQVGFSHTMFCLLTLSHSRILCFIQELVIVALVKKGIVSFSVSLQLKEMRNRVAEMESHSRLSTGVSQLENKIQELEERLRIEERYVTTSRETSHPNVSAHVTLPHFKREELCAGFTTSFGEKTERTKYDAGRGETCAH